MYQCYLKRLFGLLVALMAGAASRCLAQDMKTYEGHWEAPLTNDQAFSLPVTIRQIDDSTAVLSLSAAALSGSTAILGLPGQPPSVSRTFHFVNGQPFTVPIDSQAVCKGVPDKDPSRLRIFIRSGQWQYHIVLRSSGPHQYTGKWNILLAEHFQSRFYLSIEDPAGDQFSAYAFSSDHRFPGFACYNFGKTADSLHFSDFRTGLTFQGRLQTRTISLTIKMAGIILATLELHPSEKDWVLDALPPISPFHYRVPVDMHDGLTVAPLYKAGFMLMPIKKMEDSIKAGSITQIHSVLIARAGRLVYEKYFDGFGAATPHDMRSASKSISSALIGIAMDQGILKDTSQKLFDLIPPAYRYAEKSDPRKSLISIGNLLTMRSGLDAVDFGIDRKSAASEDVYQETPDWLKTVVEAPMINQPGSHSNYSSANPFLLGVALNEQLTVASNEQLTSNEQFTSNKQLTSNEQLSVSEQGRPPLEFFMDDYLFSPLGIDTYLVQNDCFGKPYFGGGMFLRPRDMLKFGLVYAQGGRWQGRQVISKKWVLASFKNYGILENHPEKNEYGFLWWRYAYQVGDKTIQSIEARGAGGQYIFIIPEYDLVVVVTSGNFRNHRVWQPEKIIEKYILPALQ